MKAKQFLVGITKEHYEKFFTLLISAERPCVSAHPDDEEAARKIVQAFVEKYPLHRIEIDISDFIPVGKIYAMDKAAFRPKPFVFAEHIDIKNTEGRRLEYDFLYIEEVVYEKETFIKRMHRWMKNRLI